MRESPIDEPALPRIRRNISKLFLKILAIANPMLVESSLPDFSGKLLPNLMRKAALDALGATLDGLVRRRGQQHMQMFRHHDEPMQVVAPLISIMKESLDEQLGVCRYREQLAPLVGRSGERVGFHGGLMKAYLKG